MSGHGCKRKSFTLQQKIEIIKEIEEGGTHEAVATKHALPRSELRQFQAMKSKFSVDFLNFNCSLFFILFLGTVSSMWKKREGIKKNFKGSNPNLKKSRTALYANLDEAIFQWFREQRTKAIPLDGNLIKAKALQYAEALGIEEFSATNGWFDGWKKRYDVSFKKLTGESGSAPTHDKDSWLEHKWPVIRAGFQPEDIFNADETALYFKKLPEKSYHSKYDKCNGKKKSKERVTLLVCANMTGSEKLPLLLIGRAKKPRGFPKNLTGLSVIYRNNSKAWMTGGIWEEWLHHWDAKLGKAKRKILLLSDNCSAHVAVPFFKNIEVEYFPPNVTSILQPMDQGIIQNLKVRYRRRVMEKLISHLDSAGELLNLKLIESVFIIDSAWKSVTKKTISNCFRHAGMNSEVEDILELMDPNFDRENEELYAEILHRMGTEPSGDDNLANYVAVDDEVTF